MNTKFNIPFVNSAVLLCFLFSIGSVNAQNSNEIVIKFNYSYLNFDVINDSSRLTIPFKEVLNARGKSQLKELEAKYAGLTNLNIRKIFPFLSTKDTVSISRLGQKVTIPPFWATFSLAAPQNLDLNRLIYDLNTIVS